MAARTAVWHVSGRGRMVLCGQINYIEAGERLISQAKASELFDNCIIYTDAYLKTDTAFWSQHSKFIEANHRGYGYWIWKSYLIKKTMERMADGDILVIS